MKKREYILVNGIEFPVSENKDEAFWDVLMNGTAYWRGETNIDPTLGKWVDEMNISELKIKGFKLKKVNTKKENDIIFNKIMNNEL